MDSDINDNKKINKNKSIQQRQKFNKKKTNNNKKWKKIITFPIIKNEKIIFKISKQNDMNRNLNQ